MSFLTITFILQILRLQFYNAEADGVSTDAHSEVREEKRFMQYGNIDG